MTPAEVRAFRERIAETWERIGRLLGELESAWHTEDAPPDIAAGDEWPVEMALEDWAANCFAAADRIRRNDEALVEVTITVDTDERQDLFEDQISDQIAHVIKEHGISRFDVTVSTRPNT